MGRGDLESKELYSLKSQTRISKLRLTESESRIGILEYDTIFYQSREFTEFAVPLDKWLIFFWKHCTSF